MADHAPRAAIRKSKLAQWLKEVERTIRRYRKQIFGDRKRNAPPDGISPDRVLLTARGKEILVTLRTAVRRHRA